MRLKSKSKSNHKARRKKIMIVFNLNMKEEMNDREKGGDEFIKPRIVEFQTE